MDVRIQKNTGNFFALAGAYTFRKRQSSLPSADVKPYAAGISDEPPVWGQMGGSVRAALVVLFCAGGFGAANLRLPMGGAA